MAPTPFIRPHPKRMLGALVASLALFGTACSATTSWMPSEAAQPMVESIDPASSGDGQTTSALAEVGEETSPPAELAFVDAEDDPPAVSKDFCEATANIWSHSAALNLLGGQATPEMTQIAVANVAEWLERSTLLDESDSQDRVEMFDAFTETAAMLDQDFDNDWKTFQESTVYANEPAARTYEAARSELVTFLNQECDDVRIADLRTDAQARADELHADFAIDPSAVTESDALPGHSIFTHSSGRLIASFPTAWDHDEGRSGTLVDFIASPDIDRFLSGDAIDGVRLQLVEANTIESFRTLMDESFTASTCVLINGVSDSGAVRLNITQTFECGDHGASIIGQYSDNRGMGLIIEASFDRIDASRADLIRLSSIANSALWS